MYDPINVGASFDWMGPVIRTSLQILRGHKCFCGSADEMEQLRQAGIKCYSPQWVFLGQEWVWQVKKRDYKRACKILGL